MTEEIERQWFAVDKWVVDRAEADLVCSAVLTLLRPRINLVFVDAYSDFHDSLSDEAAEAERWLLAKGALQRRWDSGITVQLDPTDNDHWAVLLRYAPWSINVDLCANSDPKAIATLHDCAGSVTAYLTPDEAANLAETVAAVAPVLPLDLLHARRRSERASALCMSRRTAIENRKALSTLLAHCSDPGRTQATETAVNGKRRWHDF